MTVAAAAGPTRSATLLRCCRTRPDAHDELVASHVAVIVAGDVEDTAETPARRHRRESLVEPQALSTQVVEAEGKAQDDLAGHNERGETLRRAIVVASSLNLGGRGHRATLLKRYLDFDRGERSEPVTPAQRGYTEAAATAQVESSWKPESTGRVVWRRRQGVKPRSSRRPINPIGPCRSSSLWQYSCSSVVSFRSCCPAIRLVGNPPGRRCRLHPRGVPFRGHRHDQRQQLGGDEPRGAVGVVAPRRLVVRSSHCGPASRGRGAGSGRPGRSVRSGEAADVTASRPFLAVVVALGPMWAGLSASYMNDVPAFSLAMVCLALGARGIRRDGGNLGWLCASLTVGLVGFTMREYVIIAPLAVGLAAAWAAIRWSRAAARRAGRRARKSGRAGCGVLRVASRPSRLRAEHAPASELRLRQFHGSQRNTRCAAARPPRLSGRPARGAETSAGGRVGSCSSDHAGGGGRHDAGARRRLPDPATFGGVPRAGNAHRQSVDPRRTAGRPVPQAPPRAAGSRRPPLAGRAPRCCHTADDECPRRNPPSQPRTTRVAGPLDRGVRGHWIRPRVPPVEHVDEHLLHPVPASSDPAAGDPGAVDMRHPRRGLQTRSNRPELPH